MLLRVRWCPVGPWWRLPSTSPPLIPPEPLSASTVWGVNNKTVNKSFRAIPGQGEGGLHLLTGGGGYCSQIVQVKTKRNTWQS